MLINTSLPPVERRTLSFAFERVLAKSGDKVAYIDHTGRTQSYRETYELALSVGAGLAALGVPRRGAVGMMLDNSIDFMNVAYGLGLTGRIQVPINTAYKHDFLAHIINDSGVSVLILEAAYVSRVIQIEADLPNLAHLIVRGGAASEFKAERLRITEFSALPGEHRGGDDQVRAADLMAYMYTSGTTGASKGVEVTHAHAYTYASREDSKQGPFAEDRILVMQPLFHLAAQWYGAYQSLIAGATCVIQPVFSAGKFWQWIRDYEISWTGMLGAIAQILSKAEPSAAERNNPLRFLGMTPLAGEATFAEFKRRFGVELGTAYGSTEAGLPIFGEEPRLKPGEAGQARQGYELRVVDQDGNDVPAGVPGELWVRSESRLTIMQGYRGLPDESASALRDGWFRTGDILLRDVDGHFFFVDRKKDALRRRGENISSVEVEAVANSFPDVLESAVVAVPAELGEDEIRVFIVLKPGCSPDFDRLAHFMIERMPYFMVPRYFEVIGEMPKTPTQKIQKHVLRAATVGPGTWDREAAGIHARREM